MVSIHNLFSVSEMMVRQVIVDALGPNYGLTPGDLSDEAPFLSGLLDQDIDQVQMIDVADKLENLFDVEFEDAVVDGHATFAEVIRFVRDHGTLPHTLTHTQAQRLSLAA